MCWKTDMYDAIASARLRLVRGREYEADEMLQVERGHDLISAYMDAHGVGFGQAVEALSQQRQRESAELRATYAERHGLDDEQTLMALWRHGIDGPARMQ